MIRLEAVEKTFQNGAITTPVLKGVDLNVAEGEYVALMGTSGTGKSTLMNILGLLDRPTSGLYEIDGADVVGLSDRALSQVRNEKIGFVFQQFNLLPKATAITNVMLPLLYARSYPSQARKKAEELLTMVGLGDRLNYLPGQMSGGQQQRVAIARALVRDPRLVLADEPTGNLDQQSATGIMELFSSLHRQGRTIVMVTHDPAVAAQAAREVHMVDGRLTSPEVAS